MSTPIEQEKSPAFPGRSRYLLPVSLLASAVIVAGTWVYTAGLHATPVPLESPSRNEVSGSGAVASLRWGDLGARMAESGTLDAQKLELLYAARGGFGEKEKNMLGAKPGQVLTVTRENAGFLLNLLWAFGLGNKNPILEHGPMANPRYGGAGRFASTGGWTLSRGNPMDHYHMHSFATLSPEQQVLVERASTGIYRPCCDNSTYFPDCNHGMAMLGLLELLASQGASEQEIYRTALRVNSFWFPDQYATIGKYLELQGTSFRDADPQNILGAGFSSASGFQRVAELLPQVENQGGGGCAV